MEEKSRHLEIQEKWQRLWEKDKVFEANPDKRKKFFVTFPYPYINAYPHIGHLFTMMRVEAFARYKRLRGYNVLFPQGWHATGSPIVLAAKRVREREPKQIKIMKDMGFSDDDLKNFEDPKHWVEYFAPECKKDYKSIGLSIDWRREFYTTSLNPHYDKFIKWQFARLKEKGFVIKGNFPVVWDPKENIPVGDHDRIEGEGETPQEFVLLKFKYGNDYIVAATLRPETMFGQTNLWVGPDITYKKAEVDGETWILSDECAKKLEQQDHDVEIIGEVKGTELLGKYAVAPLLGREIPILPAGFCDPNKGSGIVTSVPSDAPDDWMGLLDLKNNPLELEKYGIKKEILQSINIIPIIKSADLGEKAAIEITEKMGIKSSKEREKLEEAKKIVYKKGFYEGVMLSTCGKYAGMPVKAAKEEIKKDLLKSSEAELFYELTGKVVSRSLAVCIVKIVKDQWFIDYDSPEWKKLAKKCLEKIRLYPEKSRQQFEYVIDWLHAWACTREEGLGTRLPWDEKWLIESLSDSTIYMAYYTIMPALKEIPVEDVDDRLFDYIFLSKKVPLKCDKKKADAMKKEFEYWYPLDFRNSGKDLIQNHLTFFIFGHTAIFEQKHWPKGIGVNGWVTVDGQKMSKSLGNVILIRDMAKTYGADASRFTILYGGEDMDDPNWDSELAKSLVLKLEGLIEFAKQRHNKGRSEKKAIDFWMASKLNQLIKEATDAMEKTSFRTALQKTFFDIQKSLKWYLKRCNDNPNKEVITEAIESLFIMLSPFTPHTCEEAWNLIGKRGYISISLWPKFDESKIQKTDSEEDLRIVIDDINTVLKLAKIEKPKKIKIIVATEWKYSLYRLLKEELEKTRNQGEIIKKIMATELKKHGESVTKILPKIMKTGSVPDFSSQKEEYKSLSEASGFLKEEFSAEITVELEEKAQDLKAKSAMPKKPAIIVE